MKTAGDLLAHERELRERAETETAKEHGRWEELERRERSVEAGEKWLSDEKTRRESVDRKIEQVALKLVEEEQQLRESPAQEKEIREVNMYQRQAPDPKAKAAAKPAAKAGPAAAAGSGGIFTMQNAWMFGLGALLLLLCCCVMCASSKADTDENPAAQD